MNALVDRVELIDTGIRVLIKLPTPAGDERDAVTPNELALFHFSKPSDLLMMVLLDGRERTEADFRILFGRAGLKLNRIVPTASVVSIVESERA